VPKRNEHKKRTRIPHERRTRVLELMKDTLYDRDESKLIDRICQLRKIYKNLKVEEIKRPNATPGVMMVFLKLE